MKMYIESFNTEGVLILANVSRLGSFFADKEFDYSYPEGLAELVQSGVIHIITTEETVENLNFTDHVQGIDLNDWALHPSHNYLQVGEGDEIRVVAHGTFTRTCSQAKGNFLDYMAGSFRISKMLNAELNASGMSLMEYCALECPQIPLVAGMHKVSTYSNTNMNPNMLVEFTFLFEMVTDFDLESVTVEPQEIYG
jgi:hypothetical protein